MSVCPDCKRFTGDGLAPTRCQEHAERARGEQRDWFTRTGHCGACGGPGTYCTCTTPCGCNELHEVGSGLRDGALDTFAETAISDGQAGLF